MYDYINQATQWRVMRVAISWEGECVNKIMGDIIDYDIY